MDGTKHYSFHRFCRQRSIYTGYLHKTITVVSKTRMNSFPTASRYIDILSHGGTDIFKHNHTNTSFIFGQIRILYFGITQTDFVPGFIPESWI